MNSITLLKIAVGCITLIGVWRVLFSAKRHLDNMSERLGLRILQLKRENRLLLEVTINLVDEQLKRAVAEDDFEQAIELNKEREKLLGELKSMDEL